MLLFIKYTENILMFCFIVYLKAAIAEEGIHEMIMSSDPLVKTLQDFFRKYTMYLI